MKKNKTDNDLVKGILELKNKNVAPGDVVTLFGAKYFAVASDGCEDCAFHGCQCSYNADIPDCTKYNCKFKKLLGFVLDLYTPGVGVSLVDKVENDKVYLTDGRELTFDEVFSRSSYLVLKPVLEHDFSKEN